MELTTSTLGILCLCVTVAIATNYGPHPQQRHPGKPVSSPVAGAYRARASYGANPLPGGPLRRQIHTPYRNQMLYDFGAECPVPLNITTEFHNYRNSFFFDMPSDTDKARFENDLKKYDRQHYDMANKMLHTYSPRGKPQLYGEHGGYTTKKCDMCPDRKATVVGFKWNPKADYNVNANYQSGSYDCWIYWPQAPVHYVECATKYCNKPRVFGWIHRCNPDNFQTRTVLACCYDTYTNAYSKAAWFELHLPQSCECYDYACPHESQKLY